VTLPAEILTITTGDPRVAVRRTLRLPVNAQLSGDAVQADIRNLSESGLLVETAVDLAIGEILYLELPEAEIIEAAVIWSRGRFFGCEFKASLPKRVLSATLLLSPNNRPERNPVASTVGVPVADEDSFGNEIDRSSLPVLVISLVVLILLVIIGLYALLERVAVPH
jgi:hypothetical protein